MTENAFHALADAFLATLSDALEEADGDGALDMEMAGGVMTITLPNKKQWIVSKHTPTRQIWLSSPVSGGLHFAYNPPALEGGGSWQLPDGRTLTGILSQELGVKI